MPTTTAAEAPDRPVAAGAMAYVRAGGAIRRVSWPRGHFLRLRPASEGELVAGGPGARVSGAVVANRPAVIELHAPGVVAPWFPSHADLLAEDWVEA